MTTRDDIRIQVLEEFAEAAGWRRTGQGWTTETYKILNYLNASWAPRKKGTVPFANLIKNGGESYRLPK